MWKEGHFYCNCPFVDCNYSQALAVYTWVRKRCLAKLVVTMWVEGILVTALVNTGCSQTLIQANLVESPDPADAPILLPCIHWDIRVYPSCLGTGWQMNTQRWCSESD